MEYDVPKISPIIGKIVHVLQESQHGSREQGLPPTVCIWVGCQHMLVPRPDVLGSKDFISLPALIC